MLHIRTRTTTAPITIVYQINGVLAEDLSIQVAITGRMCDTSNLPNEQGEATITFNVPLDGQSVAELHLECDGFTYHNGSSTFTMTVTNNQETG